MGIVADLWENHNFLNEFTPEEKYIFLYCLTNPHRSFCGCYEITITQIANETGLRRIHVRSVLDRLQRVHKVLVYNDLTKELLLADWLEDTWSNSKKWKKRVEREIQRCKCSKFAEFLRWKLGELRKSKA